MRNAAGHLVPEDQVREHDKLRDQVARELAQEAEALHERLKAFKAKALAEIADLVAIAAERYEVHLGGKKGNVTVTTYDGQYKVQRSYAERVTFTEELEAAKELINDCILRWSEGANPHIRALVDRAFRTDSKGQIKTTAVLELLRLEIDDEGWQRAMEALKDSIQSAGTAVYVRVYKRIGDSDQYRPLALDLAAV
jgi:signal transduction protein with GAF and PtsI domain